MLQNTRLRHVAERWAFGGLTVVIGRCSRVDARAPAEACSSRQRRGTCGEP
jgi:hypothetical protein